MPPGHIVLCPEKTTVRGLCPSSALCMEFCTNICMLSLSICEQAYTLACCAGACTLFFKLYSISGSFQVGTHCSAQFLLPIDIIVTFTGTVRMRGRAGTSYFQLLWCGEQSPCMGRVPFSRGCATMERPRQAPSPFQALFPHVQDVGTKTPYLTG